MLPWSISIAFTVSTSVPVVTFSLTRVETRSSSKKGLLSFVFSTLTCKRAMEASEGSPKSSAMISIA